MIYITDRHMEGGNGHEHIARVKWSEHGTTNTGDWTREKMVDWIENQGGLARCKGGGSDAQVGVVHPQYGSPYLRTHADGVWTDNLLHLPTY